MKYWKKCKGFTLVEMIVVIAIIGVLAGILVPSMLGYVKRAKFSSANAAAKTLYNAGMVACREQDVLKPIPPGIYTGDTSGEVADSIRTHIYEYDADLEGTVWAVKIEEDVVKASVYCKDADALYFGTYPHSNDEIRNDFSVEKALDYAFTGQWS